MRKTLRSCVVLMSVLGSVCLAADWPRFRGPNGDGISAETGINKDWAARPPRQLWRVVLSDGGYAGPAVAGGSVYLVDHVAGGGGQDIVRCLDLATGQDKWQYKYADAKGDNYGFCRSTPTIDGERLYTVSREGRVHCLEAATGKVIWSLNMVADLGGQRAEWDYACSPVIDGPNLLLVTGGPKALALVNKMTGKLIWQGGPSDKPGYSTPLVSELGGKKRYVVFGGTSFWAVEPSTGAVLWQTPWKTSYDVNASMPLPVAGEGLFVSSGYGTGCAVFDVVAGGLKERWRNKSIQQHFSSGVVSGGMIYSTTDPGALVCLDPGTGRELWRHAAPEIEKGGLVVVDEVLVVLCGKSGQVLMVELSPKGYTELGRISPLDGQSWTAPIVADGKLLVRNKSAMVCLDLK